MSANFDWQTEEDDRRAQTNWDEVSEPRVGSKRKPPWRLIGLIAFLAIMVGGLVWWRVDRQIKDTMQAFRTDVVASHNLIQRAVVDDDEEVFRSVLSGRDPNWTAAEMELFNRQLYVNRSPFGLTPLEGSLPAILPPPEGEVAADERVAGIELSADLNEAIVTIDQPYRAQDTDQTVVLTQTTIYRRGDFRWLLAPPLDEFWGDWMTSEGDYLSLIYPSRDADIAGRLWADLDDQIGRMCTVLEEIDCSADLHLTVRLDTDPATLAALSQPLGALRRARDREDILELPTPTLVGLPVEGDNDQWQAGFEALSKGYAQHILGAAIAQAVGWTCCEDAILFNVLVEYQLDEMGIVKWTIGEDDHQRVLDSRLRLSEFTYLLRGRFPAELSEERLWEVRAAVDFLANGIPGTSAAGMQRILDRTRNFDQFLNRVLAEANSNEQPLLPNNLDLAWWLYAFGESPFDLDDTTEGVEEDLYLACTAVDGTQSSDRSTLFRYAPDINRWEEIYSLQGFVWMSSLPDPKTLLMQEFALELDIWRTNLWRDGSVIPAYAPADGGYSISFGESDAAGQRLVVYTVDEAEGIARSVVLDLDECAGGCEATDLPGRPFWSPDGQRAVYLGDNSVFPEELLVAGYENYILLQGSAPPRDMPLTLKDGDANRDSPTLVDIGDGRSPFWLDSRTYGFIRRISSDGPAQLSMDEIVVATLDEPTPNIIITEADLLQFLPETISGRGVSLEYVATHRQQPDRLFIVLTESNSHQAFVILYDLETRMPEVKLQLFYNPNHSLTFSPDGRYIVMSGQDVRDGIADNNSTTLLIHEIETNRTIPMMMRLPFFLPSVGYDWSADSRWLAISIEDNLIGLVSPDNGEVSLIPHSYGACTSVAWLLP